jgi:hypothetical protein
MRYAWFVLLLSLSLHGAAEEMVRPGTVLPVQLERGLNAKKARPGQVVTARVMQDVPGTPIRRGAKVVGHVLAATPPTSGRAAQITVRFDTVKAKRQSIQVTTDLRALASLMEVADAQVPASGPDRGTSQYAWTTTQIGGDVVYRGGGPVARGLEVVGEPAPHGALGHLRSDLGKPCRGVVDDNDQLQALWLFSGDACGISGCKDPAYRAHGSCRRNCAGVRERESRD